MELGKAHTTLAYCIKHYIEHLIFQNLVGKKTCEIIFEEIAKD